MQIKDSHYKMPPEWAPHERTYISCSVKSSMVYPDMHADVCKGYAGIVRAMAEFEPVTVVVNPEDLESVKALELGERVELLSIEHSDAWLRDNGLLFSQTSMVSWQVLTGSLTPGVANTPHGTWMTRLHRKFWTNLEFHGLMHRL